MNTVVMGRVQPRAYEAICGVLETLPDVGFVVFFDIEEDVNAVVRCGMIVVGGVSVRQVVAALTEAHLGHVVAANCLAMSASELWRRVYSRDPYVAAAMASRTRRVHPRAAEVVLDRLLDRSRRFHRRDDCAISDATDAGIGAASDEEHDLHCTVVSP